ncbi:Ni/Fe hydrogenase subunit gamma [Dissulfurispira thermophila]|uniref:Ni/Fe hydrogenase subunit gamma n=2 Tax=root TaxID=1 RepID=A0A7G1GYL1_9BACT|nr:FAD/NAD(P)-binding protein [Dissulfurispira thermophila]BCB95550.1 Ni/Fe hydrogenase subunit gamma [Dissulfurispira thermophila]
MYDKTIPFDAAIRWIKKETRDTTTYAIKIINREIQRLYAFKPGQFNMLYLPGIGEAPISISSAPIDNEIMHTIRIAGDVTTHISRLNTGDVIGVRGPFGSSWPLEEIEDRDLMIIAGGVGIAPLRSVIRHLLVGKRRKKSSIQYQTGKKIILYGAKTPKDMIFRDEFPRYMDAFEVFLTVDKADPEEYWRGEVGLITGLLNKVSFNPLNTVVFMCGPEVMMQSMVRELMLRGVPGEKIFISMERNMNCGMGICGHCMFGPKFVCKDGPVFRFTDIEGFLGIKEI